MGVCCYLSLSLRQILGRRRGGGLEVRETGTALLCRNTTCLSTYFLSLLFLSVGESMDEPNPSPKRHPTSGISFFSLDIEAWKAVWWWAACSATLMGAGSTSRPPLEDSGGGQRSIGLTVAGQWCCSNGGARCYRSIAA
jgi:hypothetical protein